MKVALDATYSIAKEPSGVAAYSVNLIRALLAEAPADRFDLHYRPNRYLRALLSAKPGPNARRRLLRDGGRHGTFHGLNQRLPQGSFDHAITTFHDLFVMTGDYSTPDFRQRFTALARDAAARSDHIITVSQFTANQVSELLDYPPHQITVVHHGVDPVPDFPAAELDQFRRDEQLEGRFLLHIGAIQSRKNIARLVEAFEGLPADLQLVLAGSAGYGTRNILERIERSPASGRIRILGYVDPIRRAKLYRTASALAFPSLDEGFGIPVLEALSANLPVVTSNRSALPEVAGDASLLVDPLEIDSIRNGLARILNDEDLRTRLTASGLAHSAQFTWEKAAAQTRAIYG